MKRFSLTLAAAALALAGCSDGAVNPLAETMVLAVTGMPSPPLTREQVSAIPYATLAGRIGKGPRSLLVLAEAGGGQSVYAAADRSLLVFRSGRLVRTVGLARNLQRSAISGPDPLADLPSLAAGARSFARTIDLEPMQRYDLALTCTLAAKEPQTIEILGLRFDTTLVVENCDCPALGWSFENEFWVDGAGMVWRSLQHFYPDTPPIQIDILKPPATSL